MMKIALAGNPNTGKTTLFNTLSGSNQTIGNWPGVTVEKKEGKLKGTPDTIVQDLPGIYSLSPYTSEERISRDYLLQEKPNVILNIVDASSLERNLYLTLQLLELGIPVVVALNMMDVVRQNKDKLDVKKLSQELGCPVVEISALKKEGISQASAAAVKAGLHGKTGSKVRFSSVIEQALADIERLLPSGRQTRWNAIKLFKNDGFEKQRLHLSSETEKKIAAIRSRVETELDDDAESLITNERYDWIAKILQDVQKKNKNHALSPSDKIDRIVTNKWLALPIFVLIMGLVYYLAISTVGTWATDWINDVFVGEWLQGGIGSWMESMQASEWLTSLVVDGIIGGLGAPIGFVPQMAVIFLCLSFLEDCGYMSRIAFIMDRIFRRFGLSGKSFISFMISTGCGVPGILAARTIENENDRRMTMIVTTAMPCGAKLPIIALIAGAILGTSDAWWIAWATYLFGIVAIILSALVLKHTRMLAGEPAPFIMELPAYHWPQPMSVLRQTWQRCWHFIKKAGSILFVCCVVIWFLASYGFGPEGFGLVGAEDSFLAIIGGCFSWLFAPLGWGNWQAVAAALSGFAAKENIVSTMGVLVNVADDTGGDPALWQAIGIMFTSGAAALSFLAFNLLDAPCLAAISTLAKEMNSKTWTAFAVGWQMFYAYSIALIVYQLGTWLSQGAFGFWTAVALAILAWYLFMVFKPVRQAPKGKPAFQKA